MINNDWVSKLIDFYLGNKSPLLQPGEKRLSMGSKVFSAHFEHLIQTIALLCKYTGTRTRPGELAFDLPTFIGTEQKDLSEASLLCITDYDFYDKSLREG